MALIIDFNASKKEIQKFKELQNLEDSINIQAPDLIPKFIEKIQPIIEYKVGILNSDY